ncbi:alpha/beta fold hydrolase, partial [Bradyrhizobium sp. Leo121]|uniref:esterase/lipase family protein n=1 Tax=Bradyrhizobium sp. Leo121 TaxID=1571195 RepID=UPI0010E1F7F9
MLRRVWAVLAISWLLATANVGIAQNQRYVRNLGSNSPVIVFVHGVLGDGAASWATGNVSWPKLVAEDSAFNGASIYVHDYRTTLKTGLSINELAENLRLRLIDDGVIDHRELIFIAHSMGGLVTRQYLLKYRSIAAKTRFLFFLSTPTTGSELANLASIISRNPQFRDMRLMQSADYLANLQLDWFAANFGIPTYCAYETFDTYGIKVVDQASASNLCTRGLDPIQADHISIAKPTRRTDDQYISFRNASR